ncbi:hypothetical protein EET67_20615 [Pseudaminobacter arsenicus]|uniref:Uncharacterized protein n=1 Tax=Borborobacter arsenicus TaxID=1851146 RepID=A0A432V170_9HYPH|nr:hypothetical protein [Pseudaminobacter arsenicus]RUM95926.1 hypothetical protein EET67_20615 [Pseudaminobacter arsenicus]
MDFEDHRQLFEHLPRESWEKVRTLCDASLRAHEALLAAWNRLNDERTDLARVKIVTASQESAASRATRRIGFSISVDEAMLSSNRLALTDEDAERLDDRVRAAQERVDRADAAREAAEAEWSKFAFLPDLVRWLGTYVGHGGHLAHQPLPPVKLTRGESFRQAVERVRQQLSGCDEEWTRIETAPLPLADLKAEITSQVDRLASVGQPKICVRDATDGPTDLERVLRLRRTGEMFVSDVASPFVVWLHRDQILARLHAEAEKLDFADAMTDEQRDSAFSRLLDRKLALEFDEEAYIAAAAAEGTAITRRRDCDPRAVLEVQEFFA